MGCFLGFPHFSVAEGLSSDEAQKSDMPYLMVQSIRNTANKIEVQTRFLVHECCFHSDFLYKLAWGEKNCE